MSYTQIEQSPNPDQALLNDLLVLYPPEQAQAMIDFIDKHGELGAVVLGECNDDPEWSKQMIEERYYGAFYSEQDFAQSYMQDRADEMLPQSSFEHTCLSRWLDWEHITWQVMMDFTAIELNGMTHIFYDF